MVEKVEITPQGRQLIRLAGQWAYMSDMYAQLVAFMDTDAYREMKTFDATMVEFQLNAVLMVKQALAYRYKLARGEI